jgi:hypothetical protein
VSEGQTNSAEPQNDDPPHHRQTAARRDAENAAKKYADTLSGKLGIGLEILIFGGEVDQELQHEYNGQWPKFLSYRAVIANARTPLDWLLNQLNKKPANQ